MLGHSFSTSSLQAILNLYENLKSFIWTCKREMRRKTTLVIWSLKNKKAKCWPEEHLLNHTINTYICSNLLMWRQGECCTAEEVGTLSTKWQGRRKNWKEIISRSDHLSPGMQTQLSEFTRALYIQWKINFKEGTFSKLANSQQHPERTEQVSTDSREKRCSPAGNE